MTISVAAVTAVDAELVNAFARLVPQLSSSRAPTEQELSAIVASGSTTIFVAREAGVIVGSLSLVLYRIPTGLRARIEDVVVDEAVRGKGVGEQLSRAAIEHATQAGARSVDLTSRPSREAANRLYQRLGFELRDSNVYRFTIRT